MWRSDLRQGRAGCTVAGAPGLKALERYSWGALLSQGAGENLAYETRGAAGQKAAQSGSRSFEADHTRP
jgi:hypothetical protein